MNIVLTTNYSPWSSYSGGGQQSTHQLACSLVELGHEVTVVYTKPVFEKVESPADVPYSIRWAFFFGLKSSGTALFRPFNALSVALTVCKVVKERAVNVVHSQGEEGAFIPFFVKKRNFLFVVTPRYPSYPNALLRRSSIFDYIKLYTVNLKYIMLRIALNNADICVSTSLSNKAEVVRYYQLPGNKITIIPNGINSVFFEVTRDNRSYKGPVIFFGRISRAKGVDIFINALILMGKKAPESFIVGRGDELDRLKTLVQNNSLNSKVKFIDWLNPKELASLLKRSSMAVLPSKEESFGNAMVETLATGTPLITSTAGSIQEVIPSKYSYQIPNPTPGELAVQIEKIFNNPVIANDKSLKGKEYVMNNYSWKTTAVKHIHLYSNALCRHYAQ
jgi:glycosyltransferase involved in cell wall biosynthesis